MKKLLIFFFVFISSPAWATTYYVRSDGGRCAAITSSYLDSPPETLYAKECDGTHDASLASAVAAGNDDCACNHPNWLLPLNGQPTTAKISGGDTVVIHGPEAGTGQYRMGCPGTSTCLSAAYNINQSSSCYSTATGDCKDVAVPSGTSVAHTKIIGCSLTGCGDSTKPQLWLAGRMQSLFKLTDTSYVDFQDLEITDHSSEDYLSCSQGTSSLCGRTAFYANGGWSNLSFTDLWVHGLAYKAFYIGGDTTYSTNHNLSVTDVIIDKNSRMGWEADTCNNNNTCPYHGDIVFDNVAITFNGCTEIYPLTGNTTSTTGDLVTNGCRTSETTGEGDGLGTARTGGDWVFKNCDISHNSSDGLDLLYGNDPTDPATVKIDKSIFQGNIGNQVKFRGAGFDLTNSMVLGNCDFLPENSLLYPGSATCRGGGATIAIEGDGVSGAEWNIFNNTIYAETYGVYISDNYANSCNGNETLNMKNNIFYAGHDYFSGGLHYYDSVCSISYSHDYNLTSSGFNTSPCPSTNETCTNPKITSTPDYTSEDMSGSFYLLSDSPARDAADETATMWNSSSDYNSFSRGYSWDIGALEYGSTTGGDTPECGNNLKETGETCDGTDLNSQTCITQGFDSGTLTCAANCGSFVTSECVNAACGDGSLDAGEECDDNNTTNGDGCSSVCTIEVSGVETLLDCTEADPGDNLGVTANAVNMVNLTHTTDTSVRCDYGASYFGNFKHRFKVTVSACNDNGADEDGGSGLWALSAASRASLYALEAANDGVVISLGCESSAARHTWKLYSANNQTLDTFEDLAPVLTRYFEVERSGTALTAKIYSDSSYLDLLDTLSVTATATAYQYLYASLAYNDAVAGTSFTGTIENLDLDVGAEVPATSASVSGCGMNMGSVR